MHLWRFRALWHSPPCLRELEALGFVEITERGRAGNGEFLAPNKFRLTYRHAGNAAPTNEWRQIRPIEDAEAAARAARQPVKKNRTPVPVNANFDGGNRHREAQITGGGNRTYPPDSQWRISVTTPRESRKGVSASRNPAPASPDPAPRQQLRPWSIPTLIEVTDPVEGRPSLSCVPDARMEALC
jgi:hypothetical protein